MRLSLVVTAALAAVAGLAFHRVFGYGPILPVVAVAALVPTVLCAVLSQWPLWISLLLTVLAWAGTVAGTLLRPALADGTFTQAVREGVLGSWKDILTTLLPVSATPELLVLVHVVVWLAAFGSAELALRTRLRAAPCLPALAAFGVALPLGVDGPGSTVPLGAATVALVAVLVLLRSEEGLRKLLLGLPLVVALGGVAFAAGPILPVGADPYDPRRQVQAPPPQQRDGTNPLDRVGGWLLTPDQVLFTVGASRRDNLRLAVLTRFDGVTWSSNARFVPTGGRVPDAAMAGTRYPSTQRITIRDLPGVWVPAVDRSRRVNGLGIVVDPVDGTLAVASSTLRPGLTYQVTSEVRDWNARDLTGAGVAWDAEAREALDLPWGPGATKEPVQIEEFRRFAKSATQGATSPFQQASILAARLKSYAKYDVTAPPGHSYRQLDFFLSQRKGTPEHFATAYAVLARTLGLPTRIMVGFSGGRAAGGDVREMRAGDVMVWPEVRFDKVGWVPFNPTPEPSGRSKASSAVASGTGERKLEQLQQNAAAQQGGGRDEANQPNATANPNETSSTPWWVFALPIPVVLVIAYLVAVLTAPALRQCRRRAGPPDARIAGAWRQTLDHLSDVGLTTARTLTAQEVARFAATRLGDRAFDHLGPLAQLVDHTLFAPSTPMPQEADQAWEHTDRLGRLVTATTGRPRRALRRLHPRSLSRDRSAAPPR